MHWGFWTLPALTCLAGIAASTVTDIKRREVPDWVSYGMMVLGVAFGLIASIENRDLTAAWSCLGLVFGFGVGALLYYTGQWGGGDAKLLGGVGSLMTIPGPWFLQLIQDPLHATPVPFLILFLGLMIIAGLVYGLIWMAYLIIKNWKKFRALLSSQLKAYKYYRYTVWLATAACLIAAVFFPWPIAPLFVMLAALIFVSFYLVISIKLAENNFMLKKIEAQKLTEGDWVVGGVQLGKEWIIPKKNIGATKEQIAVLKKRAPHKEIIVKEGIPFVPSFLAAFILAAL